MPRAAAMAAAASARTAKTPARLRRDDDLSPDGLVGGLLLRRDALGVPEDLREALRRSQQVLGGRHINRLAHLAAELQDLPRDIVQVLVLLDMLGLEVVAPDDARLAL